MFSGLSRSHSYPGHLADKVHHNSRQAIKKYVKANNKGLTTATDAQFDVMFNKALKSGVEKGDFTQPKGTSLGNDLPRKWRAIPLLGLRIAVQLFILD